ncbi:hypothetical protein [Streptomyces mirabilis]
MHTPFDVRFGLAEQLREMRADVDRFRPPSPRLANDEPHQKMISGG